MGMGTAVGIGWLAVSFAMFPWHASALAVFGLAIGLVVATLVGASDGMWWTYAVLSGMVWVRVRSFQGAYSQAMMRLGGDAFAQSPYYSRDLKATVGVVLVVMFAMHSLGLKWCLILIGVTAGVAAVAKIFLRGRLAAKKEERLQSRRYWVTLYAQSCRSMLTKMGLPDGDRYYNPEMEKRIQSADYAALCQLDDELRKAFDATLPARRTVLDARAEHDRKESSLLEAMDLSLTGNRLHSEGQFEAARSAFARALAIDEACLGAEHPSVAADLNNLAKSLRSLGARADAETAFVRALAIAENHLGQEHPTVATILENKAQLLQDLGRSNEARTLLERALAINVKEVGSEDPKAATSLNNLAMVFVSMGSYNEAQPLFEQALAIRERQLGIEHPQVATVLNNLGMLFKATGCHAKAKSLLERALRIRENQLGREHPKVVASLLNLAELCESAGPSLEANALFERALMILEKRLGREDPKVKALRRARYRTSTPS